MSVALVTGGASGLGLATVKRFLKSNRKVVIFDLDSSNGSEVAQTLGYDVLFVPCDVSDDDQVEKAFQIIREKFGRLDICVNCAGITLVSLVYDPICKTPDNMDTFRRVLNVNLCGTYNVIRMAVALMAENNPDSDGQRGVIINTSSLMAFESFTPTVAYSTSKSAVAGMTLPLARELGNLGIRVVAIAPGIMDTPMARILPKESVQRLIEMTPFPKRLGKPEEFTELCEIIVKNKFINATIIRLDGGTRLINSPLL